MCYIVLEDIKDEVLNCTQDDVDEGNGHIVRTALKCGVVATEIAEPISPIVKRLGVMYACYNRALNTVGTDPTVTVDGSRSEDIYNIKRKTYLDELRRIENDITDVDFTGKQKTGGGAINLLRA